MKKIFSVFAVVSTLLCCGSFAFAGEENILDLTKPVINYPSKKVDDVIYSDYKKAIKKDSPVKKEIETQIPIQKVEPAPIKQEEQMPAEINTELDETPIMLDEAVLKKEKAVLSSDIQEQAATGNEQIESLKIETITVPTQAPVIDVKFEKTEEVTPVDVKEVTPNAEK